MKKVLSLILALAMVFALVACGEKQPATDGDASSDGDKSARGNVIIPPARPSPRFGRTTSRV